MPMPELQGGAVVAALWAAVEIAKVVARKMRTDQEVDLDDRRLLSADERTFRADVLTELRFTRGELARVNAELATCQRQHADGVTERIHLAEKVGALCRELERFRTAAAAAGLILDSGA